MPNTYTDTTVNNLVVNVLTNDQYSSLTPSSDELYLITDDYVNDYINAGDTLTISTPVRGAMYVAGQSKTIVFTIPLGKYVTASSVSCSSMTVGIYTYDGYIFGTSTNVVTNATYSTTVTLNKDINAINVSIAKADGTAFTSSNCTINPYGAGAYALTGATFTFS